MANLKVSKELLSEVLELSKEASNNIDSAYWALFGHEHADVSGFKNNARSNSQYWANNHWEKHKDKANVSKSSYQKEKWDSILKEKVVYFDEAGYNEAVKNGAQAWVSSKVNEYNGKMNGMEKDFKDDTRNAIKKIVTSFDKINQLITEFESINPSLKDALEKIESQVTEGGAFAVKGEEITTEDGNTVETYALYFSPDGTEEGMAKVGEVLNCAYTTIGMTSAYGDYVKNGTTMTDEEFDEYMASFVEQVGAQTDAYRQKGFFSVVSSQNIANMYEDAMGHEYDSSRVASEYKDVAGYYFAQDDDDLTDTEASQFGPMAMAAAVAVAMGNVGNIELPDELKTTGKEENKKKDEEESKPSADANVNGNGGDVQPVQPDPVLPPEEPEPELPQEEPEPELPPEEPEPEEPVPTPEVSEEVAQGVRDSITANENLNPPEEVEGIELTSEDIDNQVRDEYYSDPNLAENRVKAVDTYDTMTDSERVESLEALGYTTVVAAGLVADKAAGQAAYVIGIDEQNMANMSNALAAQNGITNHNTRFDDGHNLSYFESGQAGVDMAPANAEVQAARANLTTARGNYNSAVTTANSAINEANESKERYNSTLSNIKKKKGDNPQDWSQEDVDEYNKAAREYNEAVDKANKAVADAEAQRAAYERERAAYDKAYEECRKQAEAGLQTVNDNDQSDVIAESVPAVPDVVENVNEEGVFSTEAIPMTSPGSEEVTEPVTNTPVNTEEPTPTLNDTFYEE